MINPLPARACARVLPAVRRNFLTALAFVLGIGGILSQTATAGPGDHTPANLVEKEVARRQKLVDDAKLHIIEGDELVEQREYGLAVDRYFAAYTMTDDSALALPVHDLARKRFASFSVVHARELAQAARYDDAHAALDRVLAPEVAPDHKSARELKRQLDDPERYNPALSPEHLKAVEKVTRLFEVADGHMRLGNFDMANLTFASILREDPTNETARRGMEAAELKISDYHDSARDHLRSKMLSDVDSLWELQVPLSTQAFDTAVELHGASMSSAIADRMRNILVPRIDFTDEPLSSVADYLTRVSRDLDPTGTGVNFVLQFAPEEAEMREISVNMILNNAPLGEVVRFVTESTNTKFRIEQSAVVITSLNSLSTELVTRSFLVPPDFLSSPPDTGGSVDDDIFGGGGGEKKSGLLTLRQSARSYLEGAGVTFPGGSFATHTVNNNTLIVRNTPNNLGLVEAIVDNLNKGNQNSVRISIKQIEVNTSNLNELTFDHVLGMFNLPGSSGTFGAGGSRLQSADGYPFTLPGVDAPVGQFSLTEGIRSGDFALRGNAIDNVVDGDPVSGPSLTKAPGTFAITGAFTDPQYQLVMRAINQSKIATVTNQATTVTRPGQRAVIDGVREFIYPTEYDPPEIPQSFSQNRNDAVLIDPVNQLIILLPGQDPPNTFPVTPAHPTAFDVRNVGTHFEVEPTIDQDGFTVTLNMTLDFVQFEGFINYGTPITTTDGVVLTDNRILQPLFKVNRLAQPVHVHDGANFVIGGIMDEDVEFTDDKVPFLGDLPIAGRLFRGNVKERRRKAVLFFVNVQILDPSGNRVNRPTSDGASDF